MPGFSHTSQLDPAATLLNPAITTGLDVLSWSVPSAAIRVLGAYLYPITGSTQYAAGAAIYDRCSGASQPQFSFPVLSITSAGAETKMNNAVPHTITGAQSLDQLVVNATISIDAASVFTTGNIWYNLILLYSPVYL